jgi:hypothetical protein
MTREDKRLLADSLIILAVAIAFLWIVLPWIVGEK